MVLGVIVVQNVVVDIELGEFNNRMLNDQFKNILFLCRRRKCDDPTPQNGGMDCPGCHMDYEICNTQSCAEVKKTGSWTPWMIQVNGSTGDGGQLERRFRFSCKANVADSNNLKVALDKEQTRVCHADGSCQRLTL